MSEPGFVKEEKISARGRDLGVFALNRRLFGDLPLFLRLAPLSAVFILLASVSPSFFRWYSGKLASGEPTFTVSRALALVGFALFCRVAAWAVFELSAIAGTLSFGLEAEL